ncbi:hypothetical protein PSCICG_46630 [Pseudomonas cichorii]|nr:hypothetical protein PSCICG_46630 [Pseudomonas cichorii]
MVRKTQLFNDPFRGKDDMKQAMNLKNPHETLHSDPELRLLSETELEQVGGGFEFSAFGYTFAGGQSFAPGYNYASISNPGGVPIFYRAWQTEVR